MRGAAGRRLRENVVGYALLKSIHLEALRENAREHALAIAAA